MQRTRRAILDHLKRKPGATLDELAAAGGIAPITARSHVGILTAGGLVRATEVPKGRGRPARRYFLTEAADAYFPKQYDRLAVNLLAGLSQLEGQAALQALVGHVAEGMAAGYAPRVQGKALRERVAAISDIIEEQGGAADWEETAAGYVVHEHNCPYLSVSRCSDHVCEIDRRVVARLAETTVEVTQRLRDGADSCDFVIEATPAPGESGARVPAPSPVARSAAAPRGLVPRPRGPRSSEPGAGASGSAAEPGRRGGGPRSGRPPGPP